MKAIILACLLVIGGLFAKDVELKNADEPFIDLSESVVDSEKGVGGIEEAGLSEIEIEETVKPTEAPAEVRMVIDVRDRTVRLNGEECTNIDEMLIKLKQAYKPGMQVILADDYAELWTYKEVRDRLAEKGYVFIEEAR